MRDVPQLKFVREGQGWSQRDLAAMSGVAQNTISQLERGERKAMPSTVRKLADALGVEPWALLGDALTPREHEVLNLIQQGYTKRQVAVKMSMSLSTVMAHVGRIMTKLRDTTLEANRQREADQRQEPQPSRQQGTDWELEYDPARWAEYYVSGEVANREKASIEEEIALMQSDADRPLPEELIAGMRSSAEERHLNNIVPALLSYAEDLFVARSRLVSRDPKETIEAAQLVLRRAKIIVEEYDSKLQSFRRIPEQYYADAAAHWRIMKLQRALSEQRVAAAEAARELMDLYDESLDTLEDQIIGMREEGDVLEGFVTQAHEWER